ncbi:alpha/beta hydrolase [soil metagenome]
MALKSRYPLGPRRTGSAAPDALAAVRAAMVDAISPYPLADGVTVEERTIGGVRCIVADPADIAQGDIVYFHGGGYRLGGPDRMAGFLSLLAAQSGCRVIAPAYALAPENPYPAALLDAASVIEAVVADAPDRPLIIGGDSAGGGLAAACCVGFGEALPSLLGAVLLSPWLDLRICADTFDSRADTDRLFSRQSASDAANAYLHGLPADTPLASPLLADALDGVPPTLIIAGSAEVLMQDSVAFAARLAAQHIGVDLIVVPHMQHVSPTLFPDLPSSPYALSIIGRFVRDRIGGGGLIADPPT